MIKRCLKSRIFWLLMSILVLGIAYYYWEISSYYDEYAELLITTLFMVFNVLCLVNLSRKNWIKRLLTILICSFAISLFWNIGYQEDFFDYDLLYSISALLFFFVYLPEHWFY